MKIFNSITPAVGFVAMLSITAADAVPLYYTLEGNTDGSGDGDVYHELTGLSLDDPVSYVFYVDDTVSSSLLPDGRVQEFGYSTSEIGEGGLRSSVEYHATLVSGTGLDIEGSAAPAVFSGFFTFAPWEEVAGFGELGFFGHTSNGSLAVYSYPFLHRSGMASYDDFVQNLRESSMGDQSTLRLLDDQRNEYRFEFDLRLTSISETAPHTAVPEPSVFYLMGLGLTGIGAVRLRRKLNQT
jgi:hypothetical protein